MNELNEKFLEKHRFHRDAVWMCNTDESNYRPSGTLRVK